MKVKLAYSFPLCTIEGWTECRYPNQDCVCKNNIERNYVRNINKINDLRDVYQFAKKKNERKSWGRNKPMKLAWRISKRNKTNQFRFCHLFQKIYFDLDVSKSIAAKRYEWSWANYDVGSKRVITKFCYGFLSLRRCFHVVDRYSSSILVCCEEVWGQFIRNSSEPCLRTVEYSLKFSKYLESYIVEPRAGLRILKTVSCRRIFFIVPSRRPSSGFILV